MLRSLPVWLLAAALTAVLGCGGGDATDSGAVASNSNESAPATGGDAAPTDSGSGMMAGSAEDADMYGDDADDPSAEMMEGYADEGGATPEDDTAEMMEAYGTGEDGFEDGEFDDAADADTAEMEAFYGAEGEDYDGEDGSSPEEMEELYGSNGPGAEGADPDGEYSTGPGSDETYADGEYSRPGGGGVAEKVPEGFEGKAQLAFRRGKEKDGMQFLYAHALTTDAGAESILPTIRWVDALREPKLAVRWGVGFVVTAPRNFNGDPKPVGSQQNLPTRGGNRRDGAGGNEAYGDTGGDAYGGGGGGESGGGGNNSLLEKGAGELGQKLVAAYTERVMRGDFGDVLKTAMESAGGGNRGNAGGGGYGEESYGEEDYGEAAPGGAGAGYGATAGPETPGAGGGAAAAVTQVTHIMPGLSMLGIGTQKELIERARENGIDAVVIIAMKLAVNRTNGLVTNESTLALLDTKTQSKLHTTKKFNNIAIQKARAEGKEDGVDDELEKLFEAIDTNLKMTNKLAGISAEAAARRVASLAETKHDDPLPVLAEIRMYYVKGLLEESALHAAYEKMLGVDGRLLATGEEEDKKRALDRWLPEI